MESYKLRIDLTPKQAKDISRWVDNHTSDLPFGVKFVVIGEPQFGTVHINLRLWVGEDAEKIFEALSVIAEKPVTP